MRSLESPPQSRSLELEKSTLCAQPLSTAAPNAPRVSQGLLDDLTITDLQTGMQSGKYTARMLVEQYKARIGSLDKQGPMLNHVLELNPDALTIADQRDAERKAGKTHGPLHGIPMLIKDNIDTADRMHTSAGSLALATFDRRRAIRSSPSDCARRAR